MTSIQELLKFKWLQTLSKRRRMIFQKSQLDLLETWEEALGEMSLMKIRNLLEVEDIKEAEVDSAMTKEEEDSDQETEMALMTTEVNEVKEEAAIEEDSVDVVAMEIVEIDLEEVVEEEMVIAKVDMADEEVEEVLVVVGEEEADLGEVSTVMRTLGVEEEDSKITIMEEENLILLKAIKQRILHMEGIIKLQANQYIRKSIQQISP